MNNKFLVTMIRNALVAAIYIVLMFIFQSFSSGEIQFRIAEILMILALFNPKYAIGLFIGCLISNCFVPDVIIEDIIFGSLTTLVSALLMYPLRRLPFIAVFVPVILNALVVGAILTWSYQINDGSFNSFLISAGFVGIGEMAVVVGLGLPIYYIFKGNDEINNLLSS